MEKKELSLSPNLSLSMAVRRLEDKVEKMARLRGETWPRKRQWLSISSSFFSRTLSTGLFIIVWDNQVKVFYISRGRPDVSRGGQIIPTISIKSRNLLHFSRNSLPLYISRGTKPYQDNISRGNKPYHRNISRGNIPVWYTFENTQYQQMQPMWFCIFSNRWFEETFEKTQRRKAKQMQPIWLWLFSSRTFKDTFEKKKTQWRKVILLFVCLFTFMTCYILLYKHFLRTHLKTQGWRNI